ncbi:hypothetical protein FB451DRAFT_145864 [Mycena latifolia]|nr:hypothetical protein FB451DRAFT_145864 [Mycena latifolia]
MLRLGTKMRAALEELTSSGCPAPTRHPRTSRTAGRQDTRYARGTSRSCGRPVRGGSAAARDRAHAAGVRVLGARRAVRAVRHRALYEDYPLVHECSDECEAVIRGSPRGARSPCAGGCGAGEEEGEESGLEELEEVEAAIIAQPWISWGVVLATAMGTAQGVLTLSPPCERSWASFRIVDGHSACFRPHCAGTSPELHRSACDCGFHSTEVQSDRSLH